MVAGDTVAATVFVARFRSRVYGLALSLLGESATAEETAQEAFVRAWRASASYDPQRGRVDTWLLTITRNLAVDALRRRRELPVDPDRLRQLLVAREQHASKVDQLVDAARLREGLAALPAEQSRPVILLVRTQHPPPPAKTPRDLRRSGESRGASDRSLVAPCRSVRLSNTVHGRMTDRISI